MIPSNLPTTWHPPSGPARWAQAIVTLVDYLRPRYPTLEFLGGIGDQTHVAEGNTSAHNPITRAPDGMNLVLAVDLGVTDGNYAPLLIIRNLIYAHPDDPRMAGEGYLSGPDQYANNWPLGTGWNGGNGDAGHLHVNVAAKYFPFRPDGYLPSMDLTTPWDFMTTPVPEEDDMAIEMIRNQTSGAVIGHLGGGVLEPVTGPTYSTWLNLSRPVTELDDGPWQDYTAFLSRGDQANIAAIAEATKLAIAAALA